MSERDDDNIEFDFFEEPETREAAAQQRAERRAPRGRPPRAPLRPAAGLTPLLRLVGLIAFAILFPLRVRAGERMMVEGFGHEYTEYSARTKRLIPGVW